VFAWLFVPGAAGIPAAQSYPLWFGTWTLNLAKSSATTGPLALTRATRRIEPFADEVRIVDDLVRLRGGVTHLEWTGKFDGADNPVEGVELALTNAYRRIDDRTLELTQKVDGDVVANGRLALSPDGRIITATISSSTARSAAIYERR